MPASAESTPQHAPEHRTATPATSEGTLNVVRPAADSAAAHRYAEDDMLLRHAQPRQTGSAHVVLSLQVSAQAREQGMWDRCLTSEAHTPAAADAAPPNCRSPSQLMAGDIALCSSATKDRFARLCEHNAATQQARPSSPVATKENRRPSLFDEGQSILKQALRNPQQHSTSQSPRIALHGVAAPHLELPSPPGALAIKPFGRKENHPEAAHSAPPPGVHHVRKLVARREPQRLSEGVLAAHRSAVEAVQRLPVQHFDRSVAHTSHHRDEAATRCCALHRCEVAALSDDVVTTSAGKLLGDRSVSTEANNPFGLTLARGVGSVGSAATVACCAALRVSDESACL
jgi:hypothetical protein